MKIIPESKIDDIWVDNNSAQRVLELGKIVA